MTYVPSQIKWDYEIREYRDHRLEKFHEMFVRHGDVILELGCGDGRHTYEICRWGCEVYAIDVKPDNCIRTLGRCWYMDGCEMPEVQLIDLEEYESLERFGADCIVNIGVLYHLTDPLQHLEVCGEACERAMLLDTHYVEGDAPIRHQEAGESWLDKPRAGIKEYSTWLPLETIRAKVREVGFEIIDEEFLKQKRPGPRVRMYLRKVS